jgi:NIMA (never in mitosis gene a)-related kinase 1/4/5
VLSHTRSNAKTVVGTPYYLSPEIIENKPYAFQSDVWSLGVLLYEMCALCPPFNAGSLHELAKRIIAGRFERVPAVFSQSLATLISQILVRDPKSRPTITDLLKHPLIKPRIKRYLEEDSFMEEFSHTLLHNQDVFKAFQDQQKKEELKK